MFHGKYPILANTCCRLISLVWDKNLNVITETWERCLDNQNAQRCFKKPGMKVPKKETKKDSVDHQKGNQNLKKPAMKTIKDNSGPQKPTKSKPAKKA